MDNFNDREQAMRNKFVAHGVSNDIWASDRRGMTSLQMIQKYKDRAVCPRCERWALRDKGWAKGRIARCPHCGWHGRTITIDEYLTSKLYK
ncbi:MAG: hypothetical protein LBM38_06525 [Clostridiales bacterium]|jgi:hypothetical protein|nr:hypothetical protein [Clostridiales bacterium]